jgi:hypothetical protein
MSQCIATRKLLFSPRGSNVRQPFEVQVLAPRELQSGEVEFEFSEGTAVCVVQLEGLPASLSERMYGADSLQALQLASDVEPLLRRLSKKYDLFFPSGESYFEE